MMESKHTVSMDMVEAPDVGYWDGSLHGESACVVDVSAVEHQCVCVTNLCDVSTLPIHTPEARMVDNEFNGFVLSE